MRMERMLNRTAWGVSLVLGQASAILGLMIAVGWSLALGVVLSPRSLGAGYGAHVQLPIEPPLIGLAIGAVALLIARCSPEPVARFAIAGIVLNAVPLVLALLVNWR